MARPARLLAALGTDAAGPTDADLLARFTADKDAGAFELLVYRHAPLVLRVCRAVLRDHHAAEDATQAVFLALARQARSVRGETLVGWLFRVGRRVAARAARRRPPPAADVDAVPAPAAPPAPDPAEARLLHEELARLPEVYRAPVLLCYFEGLTRTEAARRLGWPDGTVAGRLDRAKERLAARLARRGVAPALLAAVLEAVPPAFAGAVAQAAVAYSTGATAGLPAAVVNLVNHETRRAAVSKMMTVVGVVLTLGVVATGLGLAAVGVGSAEQPPPAKGLEPVKPAADLPDGAAVRLGSAALRHPDYLTHLRFTADGRHLLSYGGGKLRRWDAKTGAAVPDPAKDITTTFGTTLLGPGATRVVAPHVDHNPNRMSVLEYDLATGRHAELFPVPDRRPGGHYGAQKFVLSPDGGLLAEGWGNEMYVWDLRTRAVRHHLKFSGTQTFPGPFTPDGKHLLTAGGDDGAVRFWDVATGKQTRVLTREGRAPSGVGRLAVSPDGRWLAAAANSIQLGVGAEVAVWDLTAGDPPRVVILPDGVAHALAFGPGDLYTVEQPIEREAMPATVVTRWEAATGRRVGRWAGPYPSGFGPVVAAVSPDGGTLAVGPS
ncbi:sigma-70 family RNA polymerase sigma factor [bacterium]|nr:sigma-70 family RNA polymerase sigma factor [bacterium]